MTHALSETVLLPGPRGITLIHNKTVRHCWSLQNLVFVNLNQLWSLFRMTVQNRCLIVKAKFPNNSCQVHKKTAAHQPTGEIWFLAKPWSWLTMFQPLLLISAFFYFLQRGNWTWLVQLSCGCCKHNGLLIERWPHTLLTSRQTQLLIEIDEEKSD